jgi:hypothetical protein
MTTHVVAAPAPPEVAKAVTFIFLADEHGNPRIYHETLAPVVNGTGFFAVVENEKPQGCMEPALHIEGFSNPGTNEIEGLFDTVGIRDVWGKFKAIEPDQIVLQSVNTIVNRRNQIAHGKADATITLADAKIYVERAERIAEVFEQVVTAEISKKLGVANCWQQLENAL